MTVETRDLLRVANEHDAVRVANDVKRNQANNAGLITPTPGLPSDQLVLINDDEDPFAGNLNNRRVAERIARMNKRVFLSNSAPTHIGDPNKALKDVAKSKAINPDPPDAEYEAQVDLEAAKNLRPPSAGSPAANKAQQEKDAKTAKAAGVEVPKPAAPAPVWKANANAK